MQIEHLIKIVRKYDASKNSYTIELIQKRYWPYDDELVVGKYQCSKNGIAWISVN